jgi:hypothetical protein
VKQLLPKRLFVFVCFAISLSGSLADALPAIKILSEVGYRGNLDAPAIFHVGDRTYTVNYEMCDRTVAVYSAESHKLVNQLEDTDEAPLNGSPDFLSADVGGVPQLLAYTANPHERLYYANPLSDKSFARGRYDIDQKGYASVFEFDGTPYALFQKNAGGPFTNFLRVNLATREEHEFSV